MAEWNSSNLNEGDDNAGIVHQVSKYVQDLKVSSSSSRKRSNCMD